MSVAGVGKEVSVRPRTTSASTKIHGPWQIAPAGLPVSKKLRTKRSTANGRYVNYEGAHFRVDAARIWDLPDRPVPLGVAVSGRQSCELFAPLADVMIAVEPDGAWPARAGKGPSTCGIPRRRPAPLWFAPVRAGDGGSGGTGDYDTPWPMRRVEIDQAIGHLS